MNPKVTKTLLGGYQVKFDCPGCKTRLTSPLSDAGMKDTCPDCGSQFAVPGTDALQQWNERKQADLAGKEKKAEEKSQRKAIEQQEAAEEKRKLAESKETAEYDSLVRTEAAKLQDHNRKVAALPSNAVVGSIVESRHKKAGPIAKALSGLSILFLCLYYLVALLLCFTCVGIIIAAFMVTGVMAFQAALASVFMDGTFYVAECPCCKRRVEKLFLPDSQAELSQSCPSCRKMLIVRDGLVFHIP